MKLVQLASFGLLASLVTAQDYLYRFPGTVAGGWDGTAVAGLDDLDGDGVPEFAYRGRGPAGGDSVYVHAGADGSVLYQYDVSYQGLGIKIASAGDIDADGVADFTLIDYAPAAKRVRVLSGATGLKLFFVNPTGLPLSVVPVGDADGDGHDDLVVAVDAASGSQFVLVSGKTQTQQIIADEPTFSTLGSALISADVDGDGAPDFVAGGFDFVRAYRRDGTLLYAVPPVAPGQYFGLRLAALGDVDGDGCGDFVVSDYHADFAGRETGSVWLCSGCDGALLQRWDGNQELEYMGYALGAADTDGDGVKDILIGSNGGESLLGGHGVLRIVSGATRELLYEVRDAGPLRGSLAFGVAGLGDLDGDGRAEVLLGNVTKKFGTLFQAGEAAVWRGFQDCNQNGIEDRVEYAPDLDGNQDGLLDECEPLVTVYCMQEPGPESCDLLVGGVGHAAVTPGVDPLVLTARNARDSTAALLFYGLSGRTAVPFLGGTLCVQPPLERTPPVAVQGPGYLNCSGTVTFDVVDWIASGADPFLVAGAVVNAQWWTREPFTPAGVTLSEGLEFPIVP